MSQTSLSLLERVRDAGDGDAWSQLVAIYKPMLKGWLRQRGMQEAEADDMTQDVMCVLLRKLPSFRHSGRTGAFRHWLRSVLTNRLREHFRESKAEPSVQAAFMEDVGELEDDASRLTDQWNLEHDRHVVSRLLDHVRPRFHEQTWQAFHMQMFDRTAPAEVADRLSMTLGAVYMARNRVLRTLREAATGLVDSA